MIASRPLETVSHLTPLGLRFWDVAHARPITDGLLVRAYLNKQPTQRVIGSSNGTTYLLQNLPGLRAVESGEINPITLPSTKRQDFALEVQDLKGRFMPFACRLKLPLARFGWVKFDDLLPFDHDTAIGSAQEFAIPAGLPLFPSPSATGNGIVIRADLIFKTASNQIQPAAWARLEVTDGANPGIRAHGFADANGRATVLLPYPKPAQNGIGQTLPTLDSQTWKLTLTAHHSRVSTRASPTGNALPDLRELFAQKQVGIFGPNGSTTSLEITVKFGQELAVFNNPTDHTLEIGVMP
jgi:hypothetical protein